MIDKWFTHFFHTELEWLYKKIRQCSTTTAKHNNNDANGKDGDDADNINGAQL